MSGRIGGVLLAAGRARRFGADKREALLADGTTLLGRAMDRLGSGVDELLLVVGAEDDRLAWARRYPRATVLRAPRSGQGMGSSLADAFARPPPWQGALVLLADMPCVGVATVRRVREALAPGAVVVPCCDGRPGHPVGFDAAWFPALAALSGERGARALIEAAGDGCRYLETGDPGVLADIDTPEDLARLLAAGG